MKKYDENGKLIYFENSDGYWSKYKYDKNGNRTYSEKSDGYWWKAEYDENGNRIYFENSNGFWYKSGYDERGKRTYYENSCGDWFKYEYDKNGNQTCYEHNNGYWSKYKYDKNGNRTYSENSCGDWWKAEYDENGDRTYYEDSDGIIRGTPRKERMKTNTSKIEQPFKFETGEIYLLNRDVKFDNGFEIVTYKYGTPVKFIQKDNEKTATVRDSDMKIITVPIDRLTNVSAIKLSKRKRQFANYLYNFLYSNYSSITELVLLLLSVYLIFKGWNSVDEIELGTIELVTIVGMGNIPTVLVSGYLVLGLVFFSYFIKALFATGMNDDNEIAISGFNKNRKENMRELKKLKGVTLTPPHKNFTDK